MNRLQILEEVYGEVVWSESALTHLIEVMKKVREQTLDEVYCAIEAGFDYGKFAELIVQEMCNVLDKEQWNIGRDWICDDGTRIIPKVKEHFGVE